MIDTVINDQYKILELLGEGGMGLVYMALDLELERRVALKFLKADLADNAVLIQRFRDELKALAAFNHPNITILYTSITWQGHPVMVMELVEGETLQKMVNRRGPIPAEVCVPLIDQALAGVGAAHRKKIIHRDLKPSNLMLNLDGVVKVMDFGIAKIQSAPGLTRTNMVVGTSFYMAPEQIRGAPADARSDIYAMGVTLYELLAGQVPFQGNSQYEIEHAHMQEPPQPPTVHYPHIPATVVDAVMRALAKDPAARFQTAEEFAAALGDGRARQTFAEPRPIPTPPPTVPPPVPTALPTPVPTLVPTAHPTAPTPMPTVPPPTAEPIRTATLPKPVVIPDTAPHAVKRGPLAALLIAAAAIVVLTVGGFWIYSLLHPAHVVETYKMPGGGSGGGGTGGYQAPPKIENPVDLPKHVVPPVTTDAPKFELPVTTAPPKTEVVQPKRETQPTPRPAPGSGLAGRWSGSYDRCEDNRSTRVTLNLTEPVPGTVGGSLIFATPEGVGGQCTIHGVFVEAGRKLTMKTSSCSGSVPAYFSGSHESLLTYSGATLSGTVEPQEPCMTIDLKKQ